MTWFRLKFFRLINILSHITTMSETLRRHSFLPGILGKEFRSTSFGLIAVSHFANMQAACHRACRVWFRRVLHCGMVWIDRYSPGGFVRLAAALKATSAQFRHSTEGSAVSEYFKGWRRKLGCITLGMACVLMIGWLRSLVVWDSIQFSIGGALQLIDSQAGSLTWSKFSDHPPVAFEWRMSGHEYFSMGGPTFPVWPCCSPTLFDSGVEYHGIGVDSPYFQLVALLLIPSAWLLLSKSKPALKQVRDHA